MTTVLRCLAILSFLAPGLAQATLISFDPSDSTVDLGDTVSIDIVATPENGELIGAYDFLVNYDPAILAFNSLTFGASLNDDEFLCTLFGCRGFLDTGGVLSMFEAASPFLPLGLLQDGLAPVVLATIVFDTIGAGVSGLSFTGNILGQSPPFDLLGDEFGIPLPVLEPGTGTVTVVEPLPEPPAILLMLTGLLGLLARRRSNSRTAA